MGYALNLNGLYWNMHANLKPLYQPVARFLASRKLHLSKSLQFDSSFKQEPVYNLDFVRHTTLEPCHRAHKK